MPGINTTGTNNPEDYNLGRGIVYAGTLVSDLPKEYRDIGNSTEFTINVESETLEHQSSRSGLKITDKEVIISQSVNLSLTIDELNFRNLALFFSGSTATHTNPIKAGNIGSDGSEIILSDSVVLGRWYDLKDADWDSSTAERVYDIPKANCTFEKQDTPDVTLVENTDFTIDEKMGRIFIKSTATNIAAGDTLQWYATQDVTAKDPDEVQALTQSNILVALKFISENPAADSHKTEYQFHKVSLKAEGDFSLIGDDFTTMTLTGSAETNSTADSDSPTLTIRTHDDASATGTP